jgi:hypothetical protein
MRALLLAVSLLLLPSVASADTLDEPTVLTDVDGTHAASSDDDGGKTKKKAPFGFGGWAHFGGGAGVQIGARKVHPVGRVDVGFGGYLFLIYGGLAVNLSFSPHLDFVVTGVAHAGIAIPIPLIRPLIGFKFGGGLHQDTDYGSSPALQMGPQLGVHIGQIGGSNFGIRVMVDAEAIVSIDHRIAGFGIVGTIALML